MSNGSITEVVVKLLLYDKKKHEGMYSHGTHLFGNICTTTWQSGHAFIGSARLPLSILHHRYAISLTKKELMVYYSVSLSTIGPFNGSSVGLSGTVKGNFKYHSISLNGTKHIYIIKIPFRYYSNTLGHNIP